MGTRGGAGRRIGALFASPRRRRISIPARETKFPPRQAVRVYICGGTSSQPSPMPRSASSTTDRAAIGSVRRFASPAVRAAIRRRLFETLGLLAGLAGLALLVALASYNPADPSLSTATTAAPSNLAGAGGAILADLLLQGFGRAAGLPGLALLAWAWRLATHRGLGLFPARLAALLAAMPLAAAALARAPIPGPPGGIATGGVAGNIVGGAVLRVAEQALGPLGLVIGNGGILALTGLLAVLAFGLSPGEWIGLGRAAKTGAVGVARVGGVGARGAAGLFGRIFGGIRLPRRRRAEPGADLAAVLRAADAAAEAPYSPNRPRAEPRLAPEPSAPPPTAAQRALAQPPKVTAPVAPPKRSAAAQQQSLDLLDSPWRLPPLSLLAEPPAKRVGRPSEEALQANARLLEQVLEDYGVRGRIAAINPRPGGTLY